MSATSAIGVRRQPPLSIRVTPDERARLTARAGGQPLGSYIKSVLFADDAPVRRASPRTPIQNERALAQVLGQLGASRMASNLNQLAYAANTGSLACDDEVTAMIAAAYADIRAMRVMLVAALGLRGPAPAPQPAPPRKAFALAGRAGGQS